MRDVVIKVENLSKQYRLGTVGTGTLSHDMNRWWHKVRGKEDPYLKIGEVNDRSIKGNSDYVWALQNINFEVKRGEVLGIIGKNGAGKSTLLKILSRTTTPTLGTVKIKGRIASLLEVGTGFHPELSGRENIYLNGAILGMSRREISNKFDEILDFAEVERYIDTPVKRYSSGMYVRLAFAVAAHLDPDTLIVDEVLAVGDVDFQEKCLGKMQNISEKGGKTVIFVSHNISSIRNLCNRVTILDNGRVAFEGDTEEGISEYITKRKTSRFEFSKIGLGNREGVEGTGQIKFQSVEFLSGSYVPLSKITTGDTFIIKIGYKVLDLSLKLDKVHFTVGFNDEVGENLVTIQSYITDDFFGNKFFLEKEYIYVQVNNFPLLKGTYFISLNAVNQRKWEFLDKIENVLKVKVENGLIFNYNQFLTHGKVALDYKWYLG